jgi:hypothetical protein
MEAVLSTEPSHARGRPCWRPTLAATYDQISHDLEIPDILMKRVDRGNAVEADAQPIKLVFEGIPCCASLLGWTVVGGGQWHFDG